MPGGSPVHQSGKPPGCRGGRPLDAEPRGRAGRAWRYRPSAGHPGAGAAGGKQRWWTERGPPPHRGAGAPALAGVGNWVSVRPIAPATLAKSSPGWAQQDRPGRAVAQVELCGCSRRGIPERADRVACPRLRRRLHARQARRPVQHALQLHGGGASCQSLVRLPPV